MHAQAEEDGGAGPWWHGMGGDDSTTQQPLPQVGQLLRVRTLAGTPAETTARLYAVDPVSHHLALLQQVCVCVCVCVAACCPLPVPTRLAVSSLVL